MNDLSKTTQKLLALFFLTLAVMFANNILSPQTASIAKSSKVKGSVEVGKKAPDFTLKDANGKSWSLKNLKGKVVVLEWFNHGCPFVKKHYDSGNMQSLQKTFTDKGVVWLSICSSAEGRTGYQKPQKHLAMFKEKGAAPSAILIDADGKVGRKYGAKNTPDMFIIDKKGRVVYSGAIDDKVGVDKEEIKSAKNYVKVALDEVLAGKPVSTSQTKPYGCSVKYAN